MAKRPNILKLATKISLESMTYTGITYNDPEYKILEPIIDDEMCAIMMHLRLEANRTVEDVAKRAKQSVEYTQTQLDKLAKTGAVRYRYVDGKRCYFYPIWVPGIMEGILANREQCDKYPVLGESFEAYTRRRPEMLAPMLDSGKTGMFFMRVMPVMSAIENDTRTASYDELKTLIENATAISVGPCSCRRARRLMGEGCGHLEEDMCMYLNDNAVCYSEQGYHRLVTKEEAYEILRRAEDNGLVHEINQTPGFEDATAICNCCGCSCFALRIEELFRTPRAIRSNYIARVDKEKCVACGQCVENCQTNALKLGQKRCTTDPHISDTYDTDASVPYDRRSYDPEFRTNRSDVMPSGTAPCKAVCPLNIPVQGCLQLLSAGRYDDAAALIRQATPFPELCGSVCGRQCEKVCTRNQIDTAVAIADVCRTLVRRELDAGKVILPPLKNPSGIPHTEKIAVIGAGPAGLSCAYFLRQQGYPVTVLEKDTVLGGAPGIDYQVPAEALTDSEFAAIYKEAQKYVGTPYVWGGSTPETGFDCSGYVCWVYNQNGYNVGRTTANGLWNKCQHISEAEAKPGDLVFFKGTYDTPGMSHTGIYLGNGMMVSAGDPIKYANIHSSYWQKYLSGFGRLSK